MVKEGQEPPQINPKVKSNGKRPIKVISPKEFHNIVDILEDSLEDEYGCCIYQQYRAS